MRLYPPIYPGDSILQPGDFPGGDTKDAWTMVALRTYFVHSNTRRQAEPECVFDLNAIEQQARAARSAWIGSKLKSYYQALVRKFERAGAAERENFLGASQALSELEGRIREEERLQQRHA